MDYPILRVLKRELPPVMFFLHELFEQARTARIIAGGAVDGKPLGKQVLLTLAGSELAKLGAALRVIDGDVPSPCMCPGDLTIELRGRMLRLAVLSYHHARSLRLETSGSEALLFDGPALLRLLGDQGVPGPLATYETEQQRRRQDESRRFREAMPAPLRELAGTFEAGPQGQTRKENDAVFDRAVAALRAGGDDDCTLALGLFGWLGSSNKPWGSVLAHEVAPFALLRRLAQDRVLAALRDADGPDVRLGAARFAADYQTITFHKSLLRGIPDDCFARFAEQLAAAPLSAADKAHAQEQLAAARGVAIFARNHEVELAKDRCSDLSCVAISDDGPFDSLATDGHTLAAIDATTVVRIDLERGKLFPLTTYEGSTSPELVFVGSMLLAVRSNDERVDRIWLDGRPRLLHAAGIALPLHPLNCGGVLCCVSATLEARAAHGARPRATLVYIDGAGRAVPIVSVGSKVSACTADSTHVYYATTTPTGQGQLFRVAPQHGQPERIAQVGRLGQGMADPVLQVVGGDLYFADQRALCRVPITGGRVERLYLTDLEDGPIAAFTVLADGFVLVVGSPWDGVWQVERLQGTPPTRRHVASLRRHISQRLRMVVCDGAACFTLGDRLYRIS